MSEPDAPKIEFPCAYPIKVIGEQCAEFRDCVLAVMLAHDPDLDRALITERESNKGRFVSLTVTITATGEAQLQEIYADLKATGRVKMVI